VIEELMVEQEEEIERLLVVARRMSKRDKRITGLSGKLLITAAYPIWWLAEFSPTLNYSAIYDTLNYSNIFIKVWHERGKFYAYERGDLCIYRFKPPEMKIIEKRNQRK